MSRSTAESRRRSNGGAEIHLTKIPSSIGSVASSTAPGGRRFGVGPAYVWVKVRRGGYGAAVVR
jgi:hypothetical protein